MVEYLNCKWQDIVDDAKEVEEKRKYVKGLVNDEDLHHSFFNIKKYYYAEFYPDLLPHKTMCQMELDVQDW